MRALAVLTAVLIALGIPCAALAGGFEVPDQSPSAAATGGASAARTDDPSAAWYDPAALCDGRGLRASFAITFAIPTITATSLDDPALGAPVSTATSVTTPLALNVSWASPDDPYAFGLYAGIPFGSGVAWPNDWWGRFDALSSSIRIFRVAPFFAYRFRELRNFSFAVGPHVDAGSFELSRALDFVDTQGALRVLFTGASAGGHAALYVEPIEELALAFTYKSRTVMPMSGSADFSDVPDAFSGRAQDQPARTELVLPDRFVLGGALRLDAFRAYLDLGLSLWSVRDAVRIDFQNDATPDVVQPAQWRETLDLHAGAEYAIVPEVTARAGLRYEMAAAPASTLAPSSPDLDRFGLAFGAAVDPIPELGFDVAYAYTALLGGASTSQDAVPASYGGDVHLISLAVRVHVDPRPAPRPDAAADPEPEPEAPEAPVDPPGVAPGADDTDPQSNLTSSEP